MPDTSGEGSDKSPSGAPTAGRPYFADYGDLFSEDEDEVDEGEWYCRYFRPQSINGTYTVVLQPTEGDADLYLYAWSREEGWVRVDVSDNYDQEEEVLSFGGDDIPDWATRFYYCVKGYTDSQFEVKVYFESFSGSGGDEDEFLSVPLGGGGDVDDLRVSSVMDHHHPTDYYCDAECDDADGNDWVLAFDGTLADGEFGRSAAGPYGYYQDSERSPFDFDEFDYVGVGSDGGSRILNYDGHPGYDILPDGERYIVAAADGWLEVPTSDRINGPSSSSTPQQRYNTLKIEHDNGFETWYLHAVAGSECVALDCGSGGRPTPGDRARVRRGQTIAEVGRQGANGVHLHFEVRDRSGEVVDPFGCSSRVEDIDPDGCGEALWRD